MNLHAVTSAIIFVGLALTIYCLVRLEVSYRVVVRYLREHTRDGTPPGEKENEE